jgi:hypothetical protein
MWRVRIKISDGARVTLFNKGLVSCDVNQSFLILLFEWVYVSFMIIFCYRRYCMMWRHLAPPPLWVSWDIVRLLTIEKTRKHDTIEYYRRCMVGWLLFYVKGIWAERRADMSIDLHVTSLTSICNWFKGLLICLTGK